MAVEKRRWHCSCVHAPEEHNKFLGDCNILGCACKGPVELDTDCSRCNTVVSWVDGPPGDPEDRICHNCAWEELEALRAEREAHRTAFGHMKVVIVPVVGADGGKFQVVAVGLSQTVRSLHIWDEEAAKVLAHELRTVFGVVADYMEQKIEEEEGGA